MTERNEDAPDGSPDRSEPAPEPPTPGPESETLSTIEFSTMRADTSIVVVAGE